MVPTRDYGPNEGRSCLKQSENRKMNMEMEMEMEMETPDWIFDE